MSEPRSFIVSDDDDGIRLDRWFKRNMPDVTFNLVSRWARTGQLRLDGKRAAPGDRIEAGQSLRLPPAELMPDRTERPKREQQQLSDDEAAFVRKGLHRLPPFRDTAAWRRKAVRAPPSLDRCATACESRQPADRSPLDRTRAGSARRAFGPVASTFDGLPRRTQGYWALVSGLRGKPERSAARKREAAIK